MQLPTALTIGNFDGVHRGHQALVQSARALVGDDGRVIVLAFDPHPNATLRPQHSPPRLSTFEQRRAWLETAGADLVERLVPRESLLSLEPREFIEQIIEQYRPTFVVEGSDFRFGRKRVGNIDTLRSLGNELGFAVNVVDAVDVTLTDHAIVRASSTMARWMVSKGRVRDGALLFGRCYAVHGRVRVGQKRGRTIGFPTANLHVDDQLLPRDGIYAGFATRDDDPEHMILAAISVGTNPTFGNNQRTCEAHLLDYSGGVDEYDWSMTLQFHSWVRAQIAYDAVESLIAQIARDVNRVRELVQTTASCLIGS